MKYPKFAGKWRASIDPNKVINPVVTTPHVRDDGRLKTRAAFVTGPCTSAPNMAYTGDAILGIGTMHKSNAVPVFSADEAKDLAKMRRG